jgi:hypothetical protein
MCFIHIIIHCRPLVSFVDTLSTLATLTTLAAITPRA